MFWNTFKLKRQIFNLEFDLAFARQTIKNNDMYIRTLKNNINKKTKPLSRFYIYINDAFKPIIIEGTSIEEITWTNGTPCKRECYILIGTERIALVTNISGWKKEEIK